MYQNAGFIPTTNRYSEIETQYKQFLDEVHKQSKQEFESSTEFISKEEKIYSSLLAKKHPSTSFPTVAKMLATAVTQTHCEAVTEGIAKVGGPQEFESWVPP